MPWGLLMSEHTLLGPWIRRFLLEHVVAERNLSRNTQHSYRDAFGLLIPFVAKIQKKTVDRLAVADLSADLIRRFLADLESSRGCKIATRNQRLAAIRALAGFVAEHNPVHIEWCGQIRSIPFKKAGRAIVPYLEKAEMDALLAAPDRRTAQGRRDYALLLFLYNAGARATEAAQLKVRDVNIRAACVKITGKGGKQRLCPLWPATINTLDELIGGRATTETVFVNRLGHPITRFGIHTLVERYTLQICAKFPALATKRVSPHSIRHSTATHLLRAGVDINTIRGWLGHVCLDTTNIYAEIDLEMKAKALAKCELSPDGKPKRRWREQPDLMDFLRNL
jgi:integrase/recombinase XerD